MVLGHPALVWNIDWRYHLNHAETIARYANLHHALDYLGADVQYHVGPAWVAGAFQHFFGWGITEVSFLAIPIMTGIVTFAAGAYLCSRVGADPRASIVAAGMLLVIPALNGDFYGLRRSPAVWTTGNFQFSARFILNGQFAWAVGIAGVALLASMRPRLVVTGAVDLASVVLLKPSTSSASSASQQGSP